MQAKAVPCTKLWNGVFRWLWLFLPALPWLNAFRHLKIKSMCFCAKKENIFPRETCSSYLPRRTDVKKGLIPDAERFLGFVDLSVLHLFEAWRNDLFLYTQQTGVEIALANRLSLKGKKQTNTKAKILSHLNLVQNVPSKSKLILVVKSKSFWSQWLRTNFYNIRMIHFSTFK